MSGPKRAAEPRGAHAGLDLPGWLAGRLAGLVPPGSKSRWVVAFSGGADSLALLAALATVVREQPAARRVALRAVHVDHGINPRSSAWATHCRRQCRSLGVPLTVRRAQLARRRGASLEAEARAARYRLLGESLRSGEVLMTAHHLDDQLETVLLQLLRGAGVAGLAAMPECARFARGWLLRPVLGLERAALRGWAGTAGLDWVEDDSNADERFDRNYLRRRVLPPLTARWRAAPRVVARSAAHLAEARAVLDEVATEDLRHAGCGDALDVAALQALSPARRRNAARAWIQRQGLPLPDTRHLARVVGELCAARPDSQPCVRWEGAEIRRHRGQLHALSPQATVPADVVLPPWNWRRRRVVSLGPGCGSLALVRDPAGPLDGARLPARLAIHWRAGGERLRTEQDGPRRTLKEVLRVRGVLPWMRERLPLVRAGEALVAVADLVVAAEYQAGPGAHRDRWRLEWRDAPEHLAATR